MTFVCPLRVMCICPLVIFSLFLLMIYILYVHCLYMLIIIFLSHYHLYYHCHHHNHFIFFNTISHWGRIQQMNSSSMVYPYHWLFWASRRLSIILFLYDYYFFYKLFFGDHCWGVDALFHIYHMTFNYGVNKARDVNLSCRCHLRNSQIVSSV